MKNLFDKTCEDCSQLVTNRYSTSFSLGIRAFSPEIRGAIYSIYGFVRFADEIVDTFYGYPQKELLERFRADTVRALDEKISLNPILQAFQAVVHKYSIEWPLIDAFLKSMEMDLHRESYTREVYDEYIYGSAEVVGLMCLRVFCEGDAEKYDKLKAPARSLGAAFQKINFLRDLKSDFEDRGRVYFPNVNFLKFTIEDKKQIENEIKQDFDDALKGILQLPSSAKFGVYLAYRYYLALFKKIRGVAPSKVREARIRVSDAEKVYLFCRSTVKHQLKMI